jgi:hypothetical protein
MHAVGHGPDDFHEPLGPLDILVLLTLASALAGAGALLVLVLSSLG